jgi:hypothetical protein
MSLLCEHSIRCYYVKKQSQLLWDLLLTNSSSSRTLLQIQKRLRQLKVGLANTRARKKEGSSLNSSILFRCFLHYCLSVCHLTLTEAVVSINCALYLVVHLYEGLDWEFLYLDPHYNHWHQSIQSIENNDTSRLMAWKNLVSHKSCKKWNLLFWLLLTICKLWKYPRLFLFNYINKSLQLVFCHWRKPRYFRVYCTSLNGYI